MKVLVISDTHLTKKFEYKKYLFLEKIIREADKVIINGDFWDGWFLNFGEFLASEWSGLFPLLKEKNAVYVYGNHDPESISDGRVSQFCESSTHCYEFKLGSHSYHIVHGNRIVGHLRREKPLLHLYFSFLTNRKHKHLVHEFKLFIHLLERAGYLSMGNKIRFNAVNRYANDKMKRYAMDRLDGAYLIAGDSHRPEQDLVSHFLNTGYINYRFASYVLLDESGPRLVEQDY